MLLLYYLWDDADTPKTDVPELDGLGFMEDVPGSLSNLLSSSLKEIKCVESVVFSSFNPPPSYRRWDQCFPSSLYVENIIFFSVEYFVTLSYWSFLFPRLVGDLIYLDVVTLEGNKFCITGTTKMFYVNSSAGNSLDPKPSKTHSEATTLVGLLQKISSKFKKGNWTRLRCCWVLLNLNAVWLSFSSFSHFEAFREVLERRASSHPFENVQSLLPPNSWLELYPVPGELKFVEVNLIIFSFKVNMLHNSSFWGCVKSAAFNKVYR